MRPHHLLWLGLIVGAAGLLYTLMLAPPQPPSASGINWVARLDGEPIPADRYWRELALLVVADRAPQIDVRDRKRLAQQIVDQELLLQRAIDLGLMRKEPQVRRLLIEAAGAHAVETEGSQPPTEAELRTWYEAHPEQFRRVSRYRVDVMRFQEDAERRADLAKLDLSLGEDWDRVASMADAPVIRAPDAALIPAAIEQYFGPTIRDLVQEMEPGEVRGPISVGEALAIVRLRERYVGKTAPFEAVRAGVADLLRREREARVLRDYLDDLRAVRSIEINEALLEHDATVPQRYLDGARGAAQILNTEE